MNFEKYSEFMYTLENVGRLMRETEEFISKTSDNKFFKRDEKKIKKPKLKTIQNNTKHPIFWLLYKMVHVEDIFKKQNDVEEINFRIKFVEDIKKDVGWMKANKIKITQVEGEAMDSADIPLLGAFFRAVCVRNNVSLIVVKGNVYKTVLCDEHDEIPKFIIENNMILPDNEVETRAKHIRDNLFEVTKPLRAISAYKVDELREIARRLGIDYTGILKKPLYEQILSKVTF